MERFDTELLWWKYEIFMVAYACVDSWSISRNVVELWSHNGGLHEWNLMDKKVEYVVAYAWTAWLKFGIVMETFMDENSRMNVVT